MGYPSLCFGVSFEKVSEANFKFAINYFVQGQSKGRRDAPNSLSKSINPYQATPNIGTFNLWIRGGYFDLIKAINDIILQDTTNNTKAKIDFGIIAQNFTTFKLDTKGGLMNGFLPFFIVIAYLSPLIVLIFRIVNEKVYLTIKT